MRPKPLEPAHQQYGPEFDRMTALGRSFWAHNILPATSIDPVIYVDLLMQDIRPAIRNLVIANAIRRVVPARVVALVGPERHWNDNVWQYYDQTAMVRLAMSYRVDEVLDLASIRDQIAGGADSLRLFNEPLAVPHEPIIGEERVRLIGDASAIRILRRPRTTDELRETEEYAEIVEDARRYAQIFDALFSRDTLAFVTSHVDYHQWGAGVETAIARRIPVVHMQSTGALKTYAAFPSTFDEHPGVGLRGLLSLELGRIFEEQIWPRRELLRRSAELTAWRAKSNLGRPSWWRGGGAVSQQNFHNSAERRSIRRTAIRQLGLSDKKPVVTVFAHAVSDAVGSNHEAFDDLVDWFEQTVEFAKDHPEVNWLFLDHPQQAHYDATEHFEAIAEREERAHMVFRPSMALTRNALWSLTDLALTVRGSVSNEYPAYGIPALQAGWSEWSHCGLSLRADSQQEYWAKLTETIEKLVSGAPAITAEQIERARLWMWFYRAGSDVVSPLVPQWDMGRRAQLYSTISNAYSQIDSDGDAALHAVARMWLNHEAVLTRINFAGSDQEVARSLAPVGGYEHPMEVEQDMAEPVRTAMDLPQPTSVLPLTVDSGKSGDLIFLEGLAPGTSILGRASRPDVTIALKVPADRPLRVELKLARDEPSDGWWTRWRQKNDLHEELGGERVVEVSCQGEPRGHVTVDANGLSRHIISFGVDQARLDPDGLFVIELDSVKPDPAMSGALVGLAVDEVRILPADDETRLAPFEVSFDQEYFDSRNRRADADVDLDLASGKEVDSRRRLSRRILRRAKREVRKLLS